MELPPCISEMMDMFEVLHQRSTIDTSSPNGYFDVREAIQKKKEISKGQKSLIYQTKKGYYWDKLMKQQSYKPAANVYNVETTLLNKSKSQLEKKVDKSLNKYSYLDSIENQEKKRPKPAPNAYALNSSILSVSKSKLPDKKDSIKPVFIDQFEGLSNAIPGPGFYNPREISPKIKQNNFGPQKYRQIHKKQQQNQKKKHTTLSPVAYHAVVQGTFDEISTKKQNKSLHAWGTGERFPYNVKQLSKVRMPNPLPDRYDLSIDWGHQKKKKNWNQAISRKSLDMSNIYHN